MKIVLHADERPESGRGHVMRTRALAGAFARLGYEVAHASLEEACAARADLIVADSYALGQGEFAALRLRAPLCVIDDLGDRDLSNADAVLNANFGAERLPYPSQATLLLGPQYALLREEFAQVREDVRIARDPARVLVTLGGGPVSEGVHALRLAIAALPERIDVVELHGLDARGVAETMKRCTLAVSAAGVTALELATVGTPAILVTLAPNQEPGAAAMARANAAVLAGPLDRAMPLIPAAVSRLLADPGTREGIATQMLRLVDGRGAQRAAQALAALIAPP